MTEEPQMEVLTGEPCPFCHENKLTLRQAERDIPYFGNVILFSMDCEGCKYHKADLELADGEGKPVRYAFEVSSEEDLKVRVVKSASATVSVERIGSIEPGETANGYVTNVEGVLNRIKYQVESFRENSDDEAEKKKAKNILKRLQRILWGQERTKIILDDPTGNSAIISDKAEKK
ncbi:ZPR1 zinc finger domain-containing protein [Candidatus Woesearchaeota archaeon]|nr:ZPR1 zinc finger domain-containing protein [Candidatus Woesearchaeota archaeon]